VLSSVAAAGAARSGGVAIVEALEAAGVNHVFGIPGTHSLELYRGLSASRSITHVTTRHEQGAGYAADGFARASGRTAVCLVTSGPALANITAAAGTAHADWSPMLILAPGPATDAVGGDLGSLHGMKDQHGMMAAVLESSLRVDSIDAAVDAIGRAFAGWAQRPSRPMYIEVPLDLLEAQWTGEINSFDPVELLAPSEESLTQAAAVLRAALRPVVVLGGGARSASPSARALIERLDAPTITTTNAKGVLPESHPLSVGASLRLPAAQRLLEEADAVLVVGSRLGAAETWDAILQIPGRLIRVDTDLGARDKNATTDVFLHGDAAISLGALGAMMADRPAPRAAPGSQRARDARSAARRDALADGEPWLEINEALHAALPADTLVAGDSAQVSYFGTAHFWPMEAPAFLYPTNFATLGFGLPAAIGAKLGCPSRPVVTLVGDGGFVFTASELLTAVEQRLPLPIVVVNNGGYAEIRDGMQERGIAPLGTDIMGPDFAALARACGGEGMRAADPAQAAAMAASALSGSGPTVIQLDVA
jgi:thiamine pyrophosphate-dependent acetolactate synthase large subunit-like protein